MEKIIDLLNQVRNDFEYYECELNKYRSEKRDYSELDADVRHEICKDCLLYKYKIKYSNEVDDRVEIKICDFLDSLEPIDY